MPHLQCILKIRDWFGLLEDVERFSQLLPQRVELVGSQQHYKIVVYSFDYNIEINYCVLFLFNGCSLQFLIWYQSLARLNPWRECPERCESLRNCWSVHRCESECLFYFILFLFVCEVWQLMNSNGEVNDLLQCRGDVSEKYCQNCSSEASNMAYEDYPNAIGARIQLEFCFICYEK